MRSDSGRHTLLYWGTEDVRDTYSVFGDGLACGISNFTLHPRKIWIPQIIFNPWTKKTDTCDWRGAIVRSANVCNIFSSCIDTDQMERVFGSKGNKDERTTNRSKRPEINHTIQSNSTILSLS